MRVIGRRGEFQFLLADDENGQARMLTVEGVPGLSSAGTADSFLKLGYWEPFTAEDSEFLNPESIVSAANLVATEGERRPTVGWDAGESYDLPGHQFSPADFGTRAVALLHSTTEPTRRHTATCSGVLWITGLRSIGSWRGALSSSPQPITDAPRPILR
jgi:hypothetical protein